MGRRRHCCHAPSRQRPRQRVPGSRAGRAARRDGACAPATRQRRARARSAAARSERGGRRPASSSPTRAAAQSCTRSRASERARARCDAVRARESARGSESRWASRMRGWALGSRVIGGRLARRGQAAAANRARSHLRQGNLPQQVAVLEQVSPREEAERNVERHAALDGDRDGTTCTCTCGIRHAVTARRGEQTEKAARGVTLHARASVAQRGLHAIRAPARPPHRHSTGT